MIRRRHLITASLVLLPWAAVTGCRSTQGDVPVFASSTDMSALVGEWAGEYSSPATGRSGSIVFTLASGQANARGDVLMVPRGATQGLLPASGQPRSNAAATDTSKAPQTLSITFVRVENGAVSGTLEPYRDPDTGATVTTTFVGSLDGDVIEGTFTSTSPAFPAPQTGRWRATRKGGG